MNVEEITNNIVDLITLFVYVVNLQFLDTTKKYLLLQASFIRDLLSCDKIKATV